MSTGIAAIVVQFGLAMIPLRACGRAAPLTSLTISGTSGSIRHADELSITMTPAAANFGASTFERCAGGEQGDVEAGRIGELGILDGDLACPSTARCVPADRAEAKKRISSTGKSRSASSRRITLPT